MLTNIPLLQGLKRSPSAQKSFRRRARELVVAGTVILGCSIGTVSGALAGPIPQSDPVATVSNQIFLPMISGGFDIGSIPLPDDISIDVTSTDVASIDVTSIDELPDELEPLTINDCSTVSKFINVRFRQMDYVETSASRYCPLIAVKPNRTAIVMIAYNRYGYWESRGWRKIYAGKARVIKTDLAGGTPIRVYIYNPNPASWSHPLNRFNVQITR